MLLLPRWQVTCALTAYTTRQQLRSRSQQLSITVHNATVMHICCKLLRTNSTGTLIRLTLFLDATAAPGLIRESKSLSQFRPAGVALVTEDMSKMLCVLDGNLLRCACRSIARQVGHSRQVSKSPHTHTDTHTHTHPSTSRLPSAVIRCSGRVCLGQGSLATPSSSLRSRSLDRSKCAMYHSNFRNPPFENLTCGS